MLHSLYILILLYCLGKLLSLSLLLRLLRLQKQSARLILDADLLHSSVTLFTQLKWLPISQLISLRKLILLFNIVNNPEAPICLKRNFNFLSSSRSSGAITRAYNLDLKVLHPYTNSGKRTYAYTAASLFNCLDSELKQLLRYPNYSTSLSNNISFFKSKILNLFQQYTCNASHLEDLFCVNCKYKLRCSCNVTM